MNLHQVNRRQVITATMGAGLGAVLARPTSAMAEEGLAEIKTAEDAGRKHSDRLRETKETIGNDPLYSLAAFEKLIDQLVKMDALSPADANVLKKIVEHIFAKSGAAELEKAIVEAYEGAKSKAAGIFETIVAIAYDSLQYIKEQDPKRILTVVSRDFGGALNGAITGKKLSNSPAIIVACMIAGAASTSAGAIFTSPTPAVIPAKPGGL